MKIKKIKCPYCKRIEEVGLGKPIVWSIDTYICTYCGEQWKPKSKKLNDSVC